MRGRGNDTIASNAGKHCTHTFDIQFGQSAEFHTKATGQGGGSSSSQRMLLHKQSGHRWQVLREDSDWLPPGRWSRAMMPKRFHLAIGVVGSIHLKDSLFSQAPPTPFDTIVGWRRRTSCLPRAVDRARHQPFGRSRHRDPCRRGSAIPRAMDWTWHQPYGGSRSRHWRRRGSAIAHFDDISVWEYGCSPAERNEGGVIFLTSNVMHYQVTLN